MVGGRGPGEGEVGWYRMICCNKRSTLSLVDYEY